MGTSLTALQARVLEIIRRHFVRHDRAPTYREIASALGRDVRSAYQHVRALERKGIVERRGGRLLLAPEHRPEPGVPVAGRIAAGAPILAEENIEEHVDLGAEFSREGVFLLRVRGDSMTGAGINDGDLVLIRPQVSVEPGEIAAVAIGEEATLKSVRFERGRIRLDPANPAYRPIYAGPDDDVRIVGKALMTVRSLDRRR